MEMTIDDCVKELLLNKEDDTYVLTKETTDFVIETMRKYQIFQAKYVERLKADMIAMLTEIQLEIEEFDTPSNSDAYMTCSEIIQQKINVLKEE